MKESGEQSAIRKLLHLIRRGQSPAGDPAMPPDKELPDSLPGRRPRSSSLGRPGKHLSLGVFLDQSYIVFALTSNKGPKKEKVLVQWQILPLPDKLSFADDNFPKYLGRSIRQFLGRHKKVTIWCALESADLKLQQLVIPDLPAPKIVNAVFWGLKKENGFDEDTEIMDFEILDTIVVDDVRKKQVRAFSALKTNVSALTSVFQRAGFPLKGITAIPFAMQNFTRSGRVATDHDYFAIVNIRRDNSEVFCFSQKGIMLVRSLRVGSLNLVDELDIGEGTDPIDMLSVHDSRYPEKFAGMQDPAERLLSKIIRTGDYCAQNFTGNIPIQKYFFFGHTDRCVPFMNQAKAVIPAEVSILEPMQDGLSSGLDTELPQNTEERNLVLTAFSIALSADGTTPNFLYTPSDRMKAGKQRKLTMAMAALGLLLLAGVSMGHIYLGTAVSKGRAELDQIRREQKFQIPVSRKAILKAVDRAENQSVILSRYVENYLPLAVVGEICRHTPENVKLTRLTYKEPNDKDQKKKHLTLEGWIIAHPYRLDGCLGEYIINLSISPVFGEVDITDRKRSNDLDDQGRAGLLFTAVLEVI